MFYERLGAHKMSNRIQILDCTLRDGGLGLEDSKKNKISSMQFDLDSVNDIIDKLAKIKLDMQFTMILSLFLKKYPPNIQEIKCMQLYIEGQIRP